MTATTVVTNYRRGYQNVWSRSAYRCLMVSACRSFYCPASGNWLCLGIHLCADQPVLADGFIERYTAGGGTGHLKRVRLMGRPGGNRSSRPGFSHLSVRKSLGYRHIDRFLSYERIDSLQSSHLVSNRKRPFCFNIFFGLEILSSRAAMPAVKFLARLDFENNLAFR